MKKNNTSFSIVLIFILVTIFSFDTYAGKKVIQLSVSETDANIYIDGKFFAKGNCEILLLSNTCVNIRVEKIGYVKETIAFCNKKNATPPPKTYYIKLRRDDLYHASVQLGVANNEIYIETAKNEEYAWKLISIIITSYFDMIEVTDKETGYLRTSWVAKSFNEKTIRTRMIVRLGDTDPLAYRIKLISEESDAPETSVKKDELFHEWDRVLRKYENVFDELQSRLKN